MNRRWLTGYLPDPADVRRRLGLGAGETDDRAVDGREAGGWRVRWRRWLGRALRDPTLWCPNRRSVSGGVAVGLFVSWIPIPLQMLLAAVLASAMRVHVPVSVVMVWFTNPLTIAPLLYAAWRTGSTLLGEPASAEVVAALASEGAGRSANLPASEALVQSVARTATPAAAEIAAAMQEPHAVIEPLSGADVGTLLTNLADIWPALLAGCLFWASVTAVTGFVATRVLWRVAAVSRWRRRPARRTPARPAPAAPAPRRSPHRPPRRPPRS